MKSPFPGMDPFLEKHWGDVHLRLMIGASDALQPELPADLVARAEERVYVEAGEDSRHIAPAVHISEGQTWRPRT